MMPYILNTAVMLLGSFCFYKLFLQKETFYKINRFVLLSCILLSFSLPLVRVPAQWTLVKKEAAASVASGVKQQPADTKARQSFNKAGTASSKTAKAQNRYSPFTMEQLMRWAVYLYWFGVAALGINFLLQLLALFYRAYRLPAVRDGKFRLVETSGKEAPCSFANNIFINPALYDWETYNQILLHEKVHVEQRHVLDLLLAEAMLIFQWFNPFAWLLRRELEANLEFLADEGVLQNKEIKQSSYQLSLLKVAAPYLPLHLTANYNQSLLKRRVMMMNAKKIKHPYGLEIRFSVAAVFALDEHVQ